MTQKDWIAIGVALISTATAHFIGVWPLLGGHPYWSASASMIGFAIGFAFALPTLIWLVKGRREALIYFAVYVAMAAIAIYVSTVGKREFVGSYAENRLAGQFWYFAFIAFIASSVAAIAVFPRLFSKK